MAQNDNNVTEDSLTLDYNDLYKLESMEEEQSQHLNPQDIQFENEDHIEDESIVREQDKVATKKNLTFMIAIVVVLIAIVLLLFPIIFKLINQ